MDCTIQVLPLDLLLVSYMKLHEFRQVSYAWTLSSLSVKQESGFGELRALFQLSEFMCLYNKAFKY